LLFLFYVLVFLVGSPISLPKPSPAPPFSFLNPPDRTCPLAPPVRAKTAPPYPGFDHVQHPQLNLLELIRDSSSRLRHCFSRVCLSPVLGQRATVAV
jgi:hypothetical protein